uniref:Zinc finger, CCHC-type n=1 Tax=Lactuca sativa TaxID=4236 RepID=A0A9R1XPY4_LACSA|nr:hypothetical protein LSAT_V11C200057170 [Lactuca sativa]
MIFMTNISSSWFIVGVSKVPHSSSTSYPLPMRIQRQQRNSRNILKQEKKVYVLESQVPKEPPFVPKAAHDAWLKHVDDSLDVSCLMLATMIPGLQQDLELFTTFDMIEHLKQMFGQQARTERFKTVRDLHACKMEETRNMSTHVPKMKSHLDLLERLYSPYTLYLPTNLIMNSLPKFYDTFIMNYNMNGWDKPIYELHKMLKTAEKNIPRKTPHVLMIREGQVKKKKQGKKFKGKPQYGKGKGKKTPQNPLPKKKEKVTKDDTCFECGVIGHWKRNYPKYLVELKNHKGFQKSRELKTYEMVLYVEKEDHWIIGVSLKLVDLES